jgi:colanic acid biosynthesis glycosyl transferase WcaI
MNLLLLSLYYEPDVGANAVIITQLVEELASFGHSVTVVTGFPHYADNRLGKDYRGKLFTTEKIDNIRVIRTYLYTSPEKSKFLVRFLNYVSFNILSTLAGIFSGPQDIILAPSPPLTIGLSAAIIGLIKRIPYVYNVQDINPDVLVKLGILKNRLFIQFSKWLEKFVYTHARQITVLSEGFKENLLKKDVPENKIDIIPNFIDPDFIKPLSKENEFSRTHDLDQKYVILYAGNLGHSQNLENLLDCAKMMSDEPDLVFLIVGNGSRKPYLTAYADELGLNKVLFLPFQPRELVNQVYASSDISLVTLKKSIALDSVPSKIYTIMASERPVLAAVDPGSDAWNVVQESFCGICVEPENPQEMTQAIITLKENPDQAARMSQQGRAFVLQHHTRENIGEKYHQLLLRIVD